MTTGKIGGKRSRGKQREKMLNGLSKWLKVGTVTEALEATSDIGAWKLTSACAKEHNIIAYFMTKILIFFLL